MSTEEENKRLALSVIEALNARNLSQWSHYLSETYAAEYPGVPLLNKTQSITYNKRFVIAFPDTHTSRSTASPPLPRAIKSSHTGR